MDIAQRPQESAAGGGVGGRSVHCVSREPWCGRKAWSDSGSVPWTVPFPGVCVPSRDGGRVWVLVSPAFVTRQCSVWVLGLRERPSDLGGRKANVYENKAIPREGSSLSLLHWREGSVPGTRGRLGHRDLPGGLCLWQAPRWTHTRAPTSRLRGKLPSEEGQGGRVRASGQGSSRNWCGWDPEG